jgi:aspartate racemase
MLSAMKRIGLLGGMSWESSAEYYRLINEATRDRLGGLHSADCVLRSVDFADIEEMQSAGAWGEAGERLAAEARSLVAAGAELLVLCTNTMHKVSAAIVAAVEVPFLHIADATADAIAEAGISKLDCWRRRTRWSRTSTSGGYASGMEWTFWCPTRRTAAWFTT